MKQSNMNDEEGNQINNHASYGKWEILPEKR